MLSSRWAAIGGIALDHLAQVGLAEAEDADAIGDGVDVARARPLQQERHLAEDVASAEHGVDGIAVAHLERAVEHDEEVARDAALLEHAVAARHSMIVLFSRQRAASSSVNPSSAEMRCASSSLSALCTSLQYDADVVCTRLTTALPSARARWMQAGMRASLPKSCTYSSSGELIRRR